MLTLRQMVFASLLVCALLSTAVAQNSSSVTAQNSSLTITATAVDDRVRITAPASVVQMRLEVYAASGEKLFDQEIRGGNVFDWHLQDGQAQRLAPGTYVCVITAKSVSGKLTQKIGRVNVAEKSVIVQPAESQQFSAPQAQTIGPVEENSSWTIPGKDEPQTTTVIAHDGTDGQMIRGRGALTFRIGNFFTGSDKEQMRLTEDGRLGIGTNNPRATLEVAGTIRAQRILIAKPINPGNDRNSAGISAADTLEPDSGDFQPLIMGTGTQDRIAKWIDNAGTLGDSGITEIAGNVGIGTTTPGSKLVVSSNSATLPAASGIARFADADGVQTAVFADAFGTNPIFNVRRANGTATAPSNVQADQLLGVIGASGYGTSAYSGTRARVAFWASEFWTNSANGTYMTFNTTSFGSATPGGTERMRINAFGLVGIGTTNPTARLHVVGDVLFQDKWRTESTIYTPNLIGGFLGTGGFGALPGNRVTPSVVGATIGGGGFNGSILFPGLGSPETGDHSNRVTDWFGTVGGGFNNRTGDDDGLFNDGFGATVSGGISNIASGNVAIVGGGGNNIASGSLATVGGGQFNIASGDWSTVPGGRISVALGDYSFAAGRQAKANHQGAFVWADSTAVDFASTGNDQFLIRAGGGVGIGIGSPAGALHINAPSLAPPAALPGADNGLVLGTNGTASYKWIQSYGGVLSLNPQGNFVGIGTTVPDATLTVNGSASKSGGGSWDTFSDERLKTIRGRFTTGLKAVMRLQPLRYEYRRDNAAGIKSEGEYIGFGAQAVQKIIPEAVSTNDRGYLLVNNDPILWTMLNAIKEQQQQIIQQQVTTKLQQDQIAALRTANTALNGRLRLIEGSLKNRRGSIRQRR